MEFKTKADWKNMDDLIKQEPVAKARSTVSDRAAATAKAIYETARRTAVYSGEDAAEAAAAGDRATAAASAAAAATAAGRRCMIAAAATAATTASRK